MSLLPYLWESLSDSELELLEMDVRGASHYPGREGDFEELRAEFDRRLPRPAPGMWEGRAPLRRRGAG